MDEKISLEAIALYGDNYSEKVVKGFFNRKEKITGQEILSLTNVQQVNLFIIKELFKAWKEEQKKIKSSFFDYESEEVKEALQNLMNLLSNNILIDQVHFQPLVKKAVSQALMAIFDPYDYYSMLVTGMNNKLEVSSFREEIRYLKINKAPLERMLQKLEEQNVSEVSGNEAFSILDQILEEVNFTPEDIEGYVEKFSVVSPLDPNAFFVPKTPDPDAERFVTSGQRNGAPETLAKKTDAVPETPVQQILTINPSTANPVPTLNEKHSTQPRPTLAENFQRIKSIKESLTINQKFMFTKVLFHGDFEIFTRAVERLDQFDTLQAAVRYIEEEHSTTWDKESEEFHEFMELVEKRFI
jgi:hypothetical protein